LDNIERLNSTMFEQYKSSIYICALIYRLILVFIAHISRKYIRIINQLRSSATLSRAYVSSC